MYGKDQNERNRDLKAVLQHLSDYKVCLNKDDRCDFSQSHVSFYNHIFSAKGFQADPAKIDAIQQARAPQNVSEVKSLLGLSQYVSRFFPDYSTITAPLRTLTLTAEWKWAIEEQTFLTNLKAALTGQAGKVISYVLIQRFDFI